MEDFKKVLRRRMWLLRVVMLVGLLFLLNHQFELVQLPGHPVAAVREFQGGLLSALCILLAVMIIRYNRALGDERHLQLLYNREHDERMRLIRQKAGMPILMVTSLGMVVAGVVAGYFNAVVFMTLIGAALIQLVVAVAVKLYYVRVL